MNKITDINAAALKRDGHNWRLLQAQFYIDCFVYENGREPKFYIDCFVYENGREPKRMDELVEHMVNSQDAIGLAVHENQLFLGWCIRHRAEQVRQQSEDQTRTPEPA